MQDQRIARWAHTLVHYCLSVQAGEIVGLQSCPLAMPLVEAVYREIVQAGASPLLLLSVERLDEILLREGNNEQVCRSARLQEVLAEEVDAILSIRAEENTRSLSAISPARIKLRGKATSNIYNRREQREQFRWALTRYPTNALAQDANMSLNDFEEFIYDICFLNDSNPIDRWQELSTEQQRLVDWLAGHRRIHILSEGTDLRLSIEGRPFVNSDGRHNFPSGELFTSPLEQSATGTIYYDIPSLIHGHIVKDIHLTFQDGRVIEARAAQGQEYLEKMLATDEGARYLGEFAFGNNPRITQTTYNTLFDEKIGGTVHLALGDGFPEAGGLNRSVIHWDMICDLRKGGEVWVDDTLFLQDGKILI